MTQNTEAKAIIYNSAPNGESKIQGAGDILHLVKAEILTGIAALITFSLVLLMTALKPDFAGFGGRIILIALAVFTLALIVKLYLKHNADLIALVLLTIGSLVLGISFFGISGPAIIILFFPILARPYLKVSRSVIIAATIMIGFGLFLGRKLNNALGMIDGGIANSFDAALVLCGGIAASLLMPNALAGARETAENFRQLNRAKAETIAVKEQIDERTRFIAEMSHEIRTPLNAILGFSDTMREGVFGELSPQYKEYVELIHQSGTHLVDLVGDILDMSKIDAGRYILSLKPLSLSNLAEQSAAIFSGTAKKQDIEIEFVAKNQTMINGDERALRQILLNLLSNATKFTPKGGKILVHVFENDDNAWLEVSDNGRGMGEEELSRISTPYMSSENPPPGSRGTGLGLALVRRLTNMQKGNFEISSTLGKGTIVTLEFPKHKSDS